MPRLNENQKRALRGLTEREYRTERELPDYREYWGGRWKQIEKAITAVAEVEDSLRDEDDADAKQTLAHLKRAGDALVAAQGHLVSAHAALEKAVKEAFDSTAYVEVETFLDDIKPLTRK